MIATPPPLLPIETDIHIPVTERKLPITFAKGKTTTTMKEITPLRYPEKKAILTKIGAKRKSRKRVFIGASQNT